MIEAARGPVDEAKQAESAALRLRLAGASPETVQYARALNVRGRSTTDNLDLMSEVQKEVHDEQLAKIALPTLSKISFERGAVQRGRRGRDGREAEKHAEGHQAARRRERRGAVRDEAEAVRKMLLGTGSDVSGDEWNDFAEAGGNAAKQLRKSAFYFQMEPVIQTLGGKDAGKGLASLYDGVLQGKLSKATTQQMKALGLIDPKQAGRETRCWAATC